MSANTLHLPDLSIHDFRGIKRLAIPHLGRVTLLAGENGVGKTTVLEAIRIHASRGHLREVTGILRGREEYYSEIDRDGITSLKLDVSSLFHGRSVADDKSISICTSGPGGELHIKSSHLLEDEYDLIPENDPNYSSEDMLRVISVDVEKTEHILWLIAIDDKDPSRAHLLPSGVRRGHGRSRNPPYRKRPEPYIFHTVGPGTASNVEMAQLWNSVVLGPGENLVVEALNLISSQRIDRVAVTVDPGRQPRSFGTRFDEPASGRVLVKLHKQRRAVALKSMGDGALRLFGIAAALANSRGGFLLIDEAENGIHYSAQQEFWNLVLRAAQQNNVQVVATTHSLDCVKGFAFAARGLPAIEGRLVRLEESQGDHFIVDYPEDELFVAAKHNIEVR